MKLEEYLQALKECPDERLHEELGPYDNYPILARGDYDNILDLLLADKWVHQEILSSEKRIRERKETIMNLGRPSLHATNIWLNYTKLPAAASIADQDFYVHNSPLVNQDTTLRSLRGEHFYNVTIVLHPQDHKNCNLPKRKRGDEQNRDVARVIEHITKILVNNDIPFCLPNIGRYNDPDIISKRIVYYP